MVDMSDLNVIPPLLNDLDFDFEYIEFLASRPILDHDIQDIGVDLKNLPCHNQCVERCVKLVTEASAAVCGEKARNGSLNFVCQLKFKPK